MPGSKRAITIVACLGLACLVAIGLWPRAASSAPAPRRPAVPRSTPRAQWRTEPAPGARQAQLFSVACASKIDCVAVGDDERGVLIERWDGEAWTRAPAPSGGEFAGLSGVACPSRSECLAVGGNGFGYVGAPISDAWDGTRWKTVHTPRFNGHSSLADISCPAAEDCTAVGDSGQGPGSGVLVMHWDGTRWGRQRAPHRYRPPTPAGEPIEGLSGVSCPSRGDCFAVGGQGVLVEHWNGRRWRVQAAPRPRGAYGLADVSCTSARFCVAVGQILGGENVADRPFVERWNGRNWSARALPSAGEHGNGNLAAIDCTSSHACVAVGGTEFAGGRYRALIESWNGHRWRVDRSPRPRDSHLSGVACRSARECVAVGGWQGGTLIERLAAPE